MTLHAADPELVIDPLNAIAPIAARAGSCPIGFHTRHCWAGLSVRLASATNGGDADSHSMARCCGVATLQARPPPLVAMGAIRRRTLARPRYGAGHSLAHDTAPDTRSPHGAGHSLAPRRRTLARRRSARRTLARRRYGAGHSLAHDTAPDTRSPTIRRPILARRRYGRLLLGFRAARWRAYPLPFPPVRRLRPRRDGGRIRCRFRRCGD